MLAHTFATHPCSTRIPTKRKSITPCLPPKPLSLRRNSFSPTYPPPLPPPSPTTSLAFPTPTYTLPILPFLQEDRKDANMVCGDMPCYACLCPTFTVPAVMPPCLPPSLPSLPVLCLPTIVSVLEIVSPYTCLQRVYTINAMPNVCITCLCFSSLSIYSYTRKEEEKKELEGRRRRVGRMGTGDEDRRTGTGTRVHSHPPSLTLSPVAHTTSPSPPPPGLFLTLPPSGP